MLKESKIAMFHTTILRSHDKHFDVGDQVLILMTDSTTSHTFSKWTGPATVVDIRSRIVMQLN